MLVASLSLVGRGLGGLATMNLLEFDAEGFHTVAALVVGGTLCLSWGV